MVKPELGTKRICPETGRKFYDLNKDPILSPYTGKSYPLTFFQDKASLIKEKEEEEAEEIDDKELDDEDDAEAEVVSLEEAEDDDTKGKVKGPASPVIDATDDDDDDDIDLGDDDDDPFLATDDDEDDDDDDVTGIIGVGGKDDDE